MEKEDILLTDVKRILLGEAPPEFLLEVFVRTLLIYIILLFIVRWLGKRMNGQLTIMEMTVMLTLGAIVSAPMQAPDRGILQGLLLLLCTVLFQRGISYLGVINGRIEDITQGKASMLVKNGVLQLDEMEKATISRQQVFSQLRQEKIFNLGMVDRVYIEACGIFSIFKAQDPGPGLPIYPPDDKEIHQTAEHSFTPNPVVLLACINCGYVKPESEPAHCNNCQHNDWINAIN
jgi:uncharacterized membrane protein YcaP (DUF421 family)